MGTRTYLGKVTSHSHTAESRHRSGCLCSLCSSPCHIPVLRLTYLCPLSWCLPKPHHAASSRGTVPTVQCPGTHGTGVLGTHLNRGLDVRPPGFSFQSCQPFEALEGKSIRRAVRMIHCNLTVHYKSSLLSADYMPCLSVALLTAPPGR